MPKVPKLIFVIPTLLGGGAERVLIGLANRLSEEGISCLIIALNKCVPVYNVNPEVKVRFLTDRAADTSLHRLYYMLLTFIKILLYVLWYKPSRCVSFITSANIWTAMCCRLTATRYVLSERTAPERSFQKMPRPRQLLIKWLYGGADSIVVGSITAKESLARFDFFKKLNNLTVIPNAVPVFGRVNTLPVHKRKFILAVGRLEKVKGFDLLIEAFAQCTNRDVDLLIVGEGSQRSALMCNILNAGLRERVFLVGHQTNLQDYYSQCELFVLSSRYEGYPNAMIEAMSFGCPCIAVNCKNGPSDIIVNYENGILVEPFRPGEMAFAIDLVLREERLREYLGGNAKQIRMTNSYENVVRSWKEILLWPSRMHNRLSMPFTYDQVPYQTGRPLPHE